MAVRSEAPVPEAPPAVAIQEPAQEPVVAAGPPALPASSPATPRATPKAVAPPAKAPAKASAAPEAIAQPPKKSAPPPVASVQEPQLDLTTLIARLRETNAIGVMTKLALKNQVDDLLKKFRAHYQGGQKTSVAELRQPYNMLVLKVLALIQDGDPLLARSIAGSREAIWSILTDREKFSSIA